MKDSFFRKLSPDEEDVFRRWAQLNPPPDITKWNIYHPVCRQEWEKRGIKPSPVKKV